MMFTATLTSSRTRRVPSQSSEAQSRTWTYGIVYQPNEGLFERECPKSFPFSPNEDHTGKDGLKVKCCRLCGYRVKHYQSNIIMNEDLLWFTYHHGYSNFSLC